MKNTRYLWWLIFLVNWSTPAHSEQSVRDAVHSLLYESSGGMKELRQAQRLLEPGLSGDSVSVEHICDYALTRLIQAEMSTNHAQRLILLNTALQIVEPSLQSESDTPCLIFLYTELLLLTSLSNNGNISVMVQSEMRKRLEPLPATARKLRLLAASSTTEPSGGGITLNRKEALIYQGLALDSTDAALHVLLAREQINNGHLESAGQHIQKALHLAAGAQDLYTRLAVRRRAAVLRSLLHDRHSHRY